MIEIVPAIMEDSIEEIREKVEKVKGSVSSVQLDLMDNVFVENQSWPFFDKNVSSVRDIIKGDEALPFADEINYEFDLMVNSPDLELQKYLSLNPNRIIFHATSLDHIENFLDKIHTLKPAVRDSVEIGVAFKTTDNLGTYNDLIQSVDFVQLMGIEHIGHQGQELDSRVFDQIKHLKEKYPNVIINIDGAVNFDTAKKFAELGVNRLVAGSAIFNSENPKKAIEDLSNLVNG